MNDCVYESHSARETFAFGKKLGETLKAGTVILLYGDLGVGKTVFAKGLGRGLGIEEPIVSPTFTVLQIYEGGRLPLYHYDVYRIGDVEEMEEIGYEDYLYGQGVCLIEWANRIEEILPESCMAVTIEKDMSENAEYRRIIVRRP